MIVFPLRRSVGLKAATASSIVETMLLSVEGMVCFGIPGVACAHDVVAGTSCKLALHGPEYVVFAVQEYAVALVKSAIVEPHLDLGQARHHEGRGHREVIVARERCEV